MNSVDSETANRRSVRQHESQRLLRLVAASRSADAPVPDVDEVLQALFHPSHSYVLAFVSYIDDTRGIIWAAYRGNVHIFPIDLPPALDQALQMSSTKVTLRVSGGNTAYITLTDIDGTPLTYEWTLPEV